MRFQTTNQVSCEDAELVLAVLEDRLHTLAHDVVREGRRITLFGLGPSPRAMNPRDKTMIDVSAADGVTTIDADVTFQASAILGETPQDQIVLEKLEQVFEEIKAELGLNVRRDVLKPVFVPRKVIPIESAAVERVVTVAKADGYLSMTEAKAQIVAEAETAAAREDASSAVAEAQIAEIAPAPVAEIARVDEEPVEATAIARVDEEPVETATMAAAVPPVPIVEESSIRIVFAEPERVAAVEPEQGVLSERVVESEPVAIAEPEPKPTVVSKPAAVAVVRPRIPIPAERKREAERWVADALSGLDEKEPGMWRRVGWTAAAVGLVGIAIFGARDLINMDKTLDADGQPVTVSAMTSKPVSAPTPAATTASTTTAQPTTTPVSEPKLPLTEKSDDPVEVVKQWEHAMQSSDAAAQAAFYADTVGRYFLRNNVRRDAVLADKQAEIDKRKGSWALKMDRVKVEREGDGATVSLVKHFTVQQQEGEPASEWFVPTQLKLKREDGRWQIVSERALGWASSLDDLDG